MARPGTPRAVDVDLWEARIDAFLDAADPGSDEYIYCFCAKNTDDGEIKGAGICLTQATLDELAKRYRNAGGWASVETKRFAGDQHDSASSSIRLCRGLAVL